MYIYMYIHIYIHIHKHMHKHIHINIHIHIHIHKHKHRSGQHTKTETGDTEELNSEGNEKRRRQQESRVNSGVEKSPVANIDRENKRCTCWAWLTNRDSKIAKIK